jgi:hypothetical protein
MHLYNFFVFSSGSKSMSLLSARSHRDAGLDLQNGLLELT